MDRDLRDRWVANLRSGNYKQGDTYLKRANGTFCCLGVLCDTMHVEWRLAEHNEAYLPSAYGEQGNGNVLTPEGWHDLGLTEEQHDDLYNMNDGTCAWNGEPKTFAEIADWIEEHL